MNPFEGSDNEFSSGDEITKIFEVNDKVFNFEEWVDKHELTEIKECFVDHDMITLDTLNMNNPNIGKLMGDQRLILKAHLMGKIAMAIQQLAPLRAKPQPPNKVDDDDGKEGILPNTSTTAATSPPPKQRLIFMTDKENKIFRTMHKYIENLENLRNELTIVTAQDFETAKDNNHEQIELYETTHLPQLDQIEQKIHQIFHALHEKVDETKERLERNVDAFAEEIAEIKTLHTQSTDVIDGKYKHCMSIIDKDKTRFNQSIVRCKDIVKKYDDEKAEDDMQNKAFSFKNLNQKREEEIVAIGDEIKNKFDQTMVLLRDEQKAMDEYINTELNLPTDEIYHVSVNTKVRQEIVDGVKLLLRINDTPETQQTNEARKIQMQKQNEERKNMDEDKKEPVIESKDKQISNDDDGEGELYCVEFTERPFGLTLATDGNKKNLIVSTIDENSIASNVSIGSRVIKLQNEIVENLGSVAIYKLLNNKYGKVLPLKMTFKKTKEAEDIQFDKDWFNEEKWELDEDDDSNKTIRGIDYTSATMYCVYFGNDGYSKGVHYLTVKCTKLTGEDTNVRCCIGVTSEKRKDWSMKGINSSWPDSGSSSYFDGWAEEPYWYSSESITVKLDVNELIVYYFTVETESNDKRKLVKRKLIKKQNLTDAKTYHFMMCADCDPTVQYTIK